MIIDQTHIYEEYKGLWVVLDDGRTNVLASGKTLNIALKKYGLKSTSKHLPLVFKVPSTLLPYVGYGQ